MKLEWRLRKILNDFDLFKIWLEKVRSSTKLYVHLFLFKGPKWHFKAFESLELVSFQKLFYIQKLHNHSQQFTLNHTRHFKNSSKNFHDFFATFPLPSFLFSFHHLHFYFPHSHPPIPIAIVPQPKTSQK